MRTTCWWMPALLVTALALVAASDADAKKKRKAAAKVETATVQIAGLSKKTPASDVKKLKSTVGKVKGVKSVKVRKAKGEIAVRHTKAASEDSIRQAIEDAGFELMGRDSDMERPEPDDDDEDYE